ncbi:MAG: hypothetical protein HY097_09715 [Nitrospinae bacterium]|nr:hypothetical protein [Nitrospinota bacterium]MBI3815532.1 hypothetical protein [Nitrospinota bacterium]
MEKRKSKGSRKKSGESMNGKNRAVSYHLKCAKTANGLTHFVMYGDVPKKQMPL